LLKTGKGQRESLSSGKKIDDNRGIVKYYLPMNFPLKAVPLIFGTDIKITREWEG